MNLSLALALTPKTTHVDYHATRVEQALSTIVRPTPEANVSNAAHVISRATLLARRNSNSTPIHDEIIASKIASEQELASTHTQIKHYELSKNANVTSVLGPMKTHNLSATQHDIIAKVPIQVKLKHQVTTTCGSLHALCNLGNESLTPLTMQFCYHASHTTLSSDRVCVQIVSVNCMMSAKASTIVGCIF